MKESTRTAVNTTGCLMILVFGAIGIGLAIFAPNDKPPASTLPTEESTFIKIITDKAAAWENAPNDLAQPPIRAARAAAICALLPDRKFTNWTGKISSVKANMLPDLNKKMSATITIALTPEILVATTGNTVFDNPNILVEAGSPIYQTAQGLADGKAVTFSGIFTPNPADCIEETSITTDSDMTEPNFQITLTGLSPAAK